jgi:hypothetical protein
MTDPCDYVEDNMECVQIHNNWYCGEEWPTDDIWSGSFLFSAKGGGRFQLEGTCVRLTGRACRVSGVTGQLNGTWFSISSCSSNCTLDVGVRIGIVVIGSILGTAIMMLLVVLLVRCSAGPPVAPLRLNMVPMRPRVRYDQIKPPPFGATAAFYGQEPIVPPSVYIRTSPEQDDAP